MIERLIVNYLATNKRLVLPGIGAFLKKDADSTIVFVPFLKGDDGILVATVEQGMAVGRREAETIVKEYINTVNNSLTVSGKFIFEGLGVLKYDENGLIYLDVKGDSEYVREPIVNKKVIVEPAKPEIREPESKPIINPIAKKIFAAEPEKIEEKPKPRVEYVQRIEKPAIDRPSKKDFSNKKDGKPDYFLIIAIIAALITILVMVYSYFVNNIPDIVLG